MAFDTLLRSDDATLHWRQPSLWQFRFVLAAEGGREFASVDWRITWRSEGRALSGDGAWTFDHEGFWKPRVLVRADGQPDPVATVDVLDVWLQNCAELRRGAELVATWQLASYLRGIVHWFDADGQPLITFRSGTDEGGAVNWVRSQCRVDLTDAGFAHPDRDLLLCLGWYLTVAMTYAAAG